MNQPLTILALHGFLGLPSDWNEVRQHTPMEWQWVVPSLLTKQSVNSFDVWAQKVLKEISVLPKPITLLGYSMGARLAAELLRRQPEVFERAILISGRDEIDADERPERLKRDLQWAQRFQMGDWDEVVHAWNLQPVFQHGGREPIRYEADFDREALGLALDQWSVARQKSFRQLLCEPPLPLTWMVGANDQAAVERMNELKKLSPNLDFVVAEKSGHRVLFDAPEEIARILKRS